MQTNVHTNERKNPEKKEIEREKEKEKEEERIDKNRELSQMTKTKTESKRSIHILDILTCISSLHAIPTLRSPYNSAIERDRKRGNKKSA